jgi:hypothetical protein
MALICFFFVDLSKKVGNELFEMVRSLRTNDIVLKKHEQWGVVLDTDDRLTSKSFGDFKTKTRQESEARLRAYMRAPSPDANDSNGDFTIAVALASPGTGTRFIDDAMRMPLATSPHFDHFLRLAISFNGESAGAFNYPFSTRILRHFFFLCELRTSSHRCDSVAGRHRQVAAFSIRWQGRGPCLADRVPCHRGIVLSAAWRQAWSHCANGRRDLKGRFRRQRQRDTAQQCEVCARRGGVSHYREAC